jgi:dihydropyrimidinase
MNNYENRLLIRGGTLVTPDGCFPGDVAIEDESIVAVGAGLRMTEPYSVLDARGCIVLPGLVDGHTHIALNTGIYQTADDWEIGTRTAACGGVTTVVDYATQFPGQTLKQALQDRWAEAEGKACIDYGLHCMVTDLPCGREEELGDLVRLGVPSIKLYTTYRPNYYADDDLVLRLLRASTSAGLLVTVHSENDALVTAATSDLVDRQQTTWRYHARSRPALAEHEAIHRVLFLAQAAQAPVYIVHCSTGRSVELVRQARGRGQVAFAETCVQYLLLDDSRYDGDHPEHFILQPPLRDAAEKAALWRLIAEGAVSTIGTDHCDYTLSQKTAINNFTQTPGGLPGLETLLPLLYTYGIVEGQLTWDQLARLVAANPARIFGLYPRKGILAPRADADVVIFDPQGIGTIQAHQLHNIAGYNPYEGMRVQGRIKMTIARGQVVFEDGTFKGTPGRGHFIAGEPFDPERFQQPVA